MVLVIRFISLVLTNNILLAEHLEEEAMTLLDNCLASLNIDYNVLLKVEKLP